MFGRSVHARAGERRRSLPGDDLLTDWLPHSRRHDSARKLGVPGHEEARHGRPRFGRRPRLERRHHRAAEPFLSVGRFYQDFEQTGDEEVKELLDRATGKEPVGQARGGPA